MFNFKKENKEDSYSIYCFFYWIILQSYINKVKNKEYLFISVFFVFKIYKFLSIFVTLASVVHFVIAAVHAVSLFFAKRVFSISDLTTSNFFAG